MKKPHGRTPGTGDRRDRHTGLTKRQTEYVATIYRLSQIQGGSPSLKEVADAMGVNANAASQARDRLVAAGWLVKAPEAKARTLLLAGTEWGRGRDKDGQSVPFLAVTTSRDGLRLAIALSSQFQPEVNR